MNDKYTVEIKIYSSDNEDVYFEVKTEDILREDIMAPDYPTPVITNLVKEFERLTEDK